SGSARAASTMPILAPAPARFSTMTVWLSACCNGDCRSRASTSEEPAGANGTMIRIGLDELNCARAARGRRDAAAPSAVMKARRGRFFAPPHAEEDAYLGSRFIRALRYFHFIPP